jgi:thioesterase domain-containing protein
VSPIVTLRPGSARQPLFLPPSMGGELLYWQDLARLLAPGRPVYGLGLRASRTRCIDLPALAADLVADLVAFQPEGPYHLAGYSFSAALALEIAQQLRASGRTVGLLAMIDYGPGLPDAASSSLHTAARFLGNLPYWLWDDILQADWAAVAARAQRKLAGLAERTFAFGRQNSTERARTVVGEMFDDSDLPTARRQLVVEHLDAFYRYQPAVYDGRVLLFWARCRPLFHSLSRTLGWEHFARGGFDRLTVACNHDNILMAPHVATIAAGLDSALDRWDRVALETDRRHPGP